MAKLGLWTPIWGYTYSLIVYANIKLEYENRLGTNSKTCTTKEGDVRSSKVVGVDCRGGGAGAAIVKSMQGLVSIVARTRFRNDKYSNLLHFFLLSLPTPVLVYVCTTLQPLLTD